MVSPLLNASLTMKPQAVLNFGNKLKIPSGTCQENCPSFVVSCRSKPENTKICEKVPSFFTSAKVMCQKSLIPLAASVAVVFWSNPALAGLLSGFSGIESVPGPPLPQIDFLNRFNEENQKMYAENDARFKESPLLKKLLEQTKLNKEKNKKELFDKYCIRGAEWGVGDCSADGLSPEERDRFIAELKQKAGIE